MKYSETGQFTANQEKLAKEIADRIKSCVKVAVLFLQKVICYVSIKQKICNMHNPYI